MKKRGVFLFTTLAMIFCVAEISLAQDWYISAESSAVGSEYDYLVPEDYNINREPERKELEETKVIENEILIGDKIADVENDLDVSASLDLGVDLAAVVEMAEIIEPLEPEPEPEFELELASEPEPELEPEPEPDFDKTMPPVLIGGPGEMGTSCAPPQP